MLFHIYDSSPVPRLQVESAGGMRLRVKMCDIWAYFLEAGLVDDGGRIYTFLSRYCQSHSQHSFRFNPLSPFGKSILRCSLYNRINIIEAFIIANLWIRKPYYLPRRIRPQLLCKNRPLITHNLIRLRLKQVPTLRQPTPPSSPPPSRHKLSFQPIHILPTTPPLTCPPALLYFGLTLPRRHPREGVG